MTLTAARQIEAVYMRGGASKGVFFREDALPSDRRERDALLLRLIGSPDPSGRQSDGLGGATPASSKVVILAPSRRPDCDVDYQFGQVAITEPQIDWRGNCDDLAAAVGSVALSEELFDLDAVLAADPGGRTVAGLTRVRLWQQALDLRIDAWVPMRDGQVVETGAWCEEGVGFSGAEIRLEYLDPAERPLPTGAVKDRLELADGTVLEVSLIDAGQPTVIVRADQIGLHGRESAGQVDRKPALLDRLEAIRVAAAIRMGLAAGTAEAGRRSATPTVAWVAPPQRTALTGGRTLAADTVDMLARMLAMGRLHPAVSGPVSFALAVAAAIPGTVVSEVARTVPGVPIRIGHPGGVLTIGAMVSMLRGRWRVEKCLLSRSARRLMRGVVYAP